VPTAWRIVKAARADTAFDGEGARLHGGRWNSPGTAIVYTAQGESLAALELLVHLHAAHLLGTYSSVSVTFEQELVAVIDAAALPSDWRAYPAPLRLQQIGDLWAADQSSVLLEVASAIVPRERLYLVNPRHPDFARLTSGPAVPFEFDRRLK